MVSRKEVHEVDEVLPFGKLFSRLPKGVGTICTVASCLLRSPPWRSTSLLQRHEVGERGGATSGVGIA